jgi:hypothetical protein
MHQYLPIHARSFDKCKDSTLLSGRDKYLSSRIELINEFEVKVTEYRRATSDLMGIKYAKGAFFGMFNKNKCGSISHTYL